MSLKNDILFRSNSLRRPLTTNEVLEMLVDRIDYLTNMFSQPRDVLFDKTIIDKLSEQFSKSIVFNDKLIDFGAILQREARNAIENKVKDKAFWVEALQDIKTKELLEGILNDKTTTKNS